MIIDIHNHIVAGEQLQNFQAGLINSAGFHRPSGTVVTEKHIQEARWRGHKHSGYWTRWARITRSFHLVRIR
jgi:hypothetical protein